MKITQLVAVVAVLLSLPWARAQDPRITKQPTNTTVSLGGTAQFRVTGSSTNQPLTYQWWFKEAPLDTNINPSATKSLLSLTNVTLANAGPYFAVVTNAVGQSATSQVAVLEVDPTFVKITQPEFLQYDPIGSGPDWVDYDADGWLDMVVTRSPSSGGGPPRTLNAYRNNRDGTFTAVTNLLTQTAGLWYMLRWADFDGDGDLDLQMTTSPYPTGTKDLLFQNQGDGTFVRVTSHPLVDPAGADLDAAWGDYDNDGDLDVYMPYETTTESPVPSAFYRNLGHGEFEVDPNGPALLGAQQPVGASWGDYDNDGHLDLFIAQLSGRNRLFHNNGDGTSTEVLVGSPVSETTANNSWGAWADYDNDGFLDLLVVMWGGRATTPHQLYRNNLPQQGNTNHWLKVQLRGIASSTEGIGAIVRVEAVIDGRAVRQMRQMGALAWATELVTHFGLGDATKADLVRIEWPSGLVRELTNVPADQMLTITEHQEGPIPAPTLTATRLVEGAVQLTLTGEKNFLYVFEGSSDLVKWTKLAVRTNLTGTVDYTDTWATNYTQRFYRAVAP